MEPKYGLNRTAPFWMVLCTVFYTSRWNYFVLCGELSSISDGTTLWMEQHLEWNYNAVGMKLLYHFSLYSWLDLYSVSDRAILSFWWTTFWFGWKSTVFWMKKLYTLDSVLDRKGTVIWIEQAPSIRLCLGYSSPKRKERKKK